MNNKKVASELLKIAKSINASPLSVDEWKKECKSLMDELGSVSEDIEELDSYTPLDVDINMLNAFNRIVSGLDKVWDDMIWLKGKCR